MLRHDADPAIEVEATSQTVSGRPTSKLVGTHTKKTGTEDAALLTVGEIIRQFRIKRGMTQSEVAQAVGHRTPEWIGMIEAGTRSLAIEKAPRLAAILRCNAKDFTKRCLFESFPEAAQALFPGDDPEHDVVRGTRDQAEITPPRPILDLAHCVKGLPVPMQNAVISLAVNLQELHYRGAHDRTARRPIPVNRSGLKPK
jgi:transcriptional regulator with XRE-family HTH domain